MTPRLSPALHPRFQVPASRFLPRRTCPLSDSRIGSTERLFRNLRDIGFSDEQHVADNATPAQWPR